jgi:nicotinamidase-related amidase
MTAAKTLFELAGHVPEAASLEEAVLVLIDYQNEYREGPLALPGVEPALERAGALLAATRRVGAPVVHVVHRGRPGGLFDRSRQRGEIVEALAPRAGEPVVEKTLPNGFAGTDLASCIGVAGTRIIVAGFMTHNCVSSTVRAALDLGYAITLAGDACATRDLPLRGGIVPAARIHEATLAGLADRHARVVEVADLLKARVS